MVKAACELVYSKAPVLNGSRTSIFAISRTATRSMFCVRLYLYVLIVVVAIHWRVFGQGKIIFFDLGIPTASGSAGGNGNGTYNVPIWYRTNLNQLVGAETLPGIRVDLLKLDGTYLASSGLITREAYPVSYQSFSPIGTVTVTVFDVPPGATTTLLVRAYQYDYHAATNTGVWYSGEWSFMTPPLGGTTEGGTGIPTPRMTGWGPEDGSGVILNPPTVPLPPFLRLTMPVNNGVYPFPNAIPFQANLFVLPDAGNLTNVAIFDGGTLLTNFPSEFPGVYSLNLGDSTNFSGTVSLQVGPHTLKAVATEWYTGYPHDIPNVIRFTSAPVNITVILPTDVLLKPRQPKAGNFTIDYKADPGLKYFVEKSSDLRNWQTIDTNVANIPQVDFSDIFNPLGSSFYRVNRSNNP